MLTDDDVLRLQELAQAGDMLRNLLSSTEYQVLDREVFKPIEQEAFEVFCRVDPADTGAVMQAQKMKQVMDVIRTRINQCVEQGRLARHQLNTSTQEDDE